MRLLIGTFLITAFITTLSYGHDGEDHEKKRNVVMDTQEATIETISNFSNNQPEEIVELFVGIKVWPVSDGVKSKVYLKDKEAISFSCHRHEEGDPFECHEIAK